MFIHLFLNAYEQHTKTGTSKKTSDLVESRILRKNPRGLSNHRSPEASLVFVQSPVDSFALTASSTSGSFVKKAYEAN